MITDLKINEEKKKEYYEKGYWTRETIRDVWERQARAHAGEEYVADDQGCRMTYGEVDDAAARLAAWLVDAGIEPGDVVTLQFPNWAEFTIAYVACFKAGAVIQSLARNFNGADLTYAMNLVESRAYIGPTSFHGVDYEQQILDIAGDIPTLKVIARVDKKAPKHSDLPTVAEIVKTTEPLAEKVPVESDQVACLLSTSGTTGKPKEVMLTHNNILFSERVFVEGLERTSDDVMWMPAPLNHAVGFFHGLIAPMLLGGRSVLMQDFAVKDAVDLINAEGATWSMCSTPFIYDIVKYLDAHPDESLPTYVLHSCGGAPVPGALIERAHNHGILLCEIFGSTESCPHVFVPPSKCVEWNGDWSGIPFPGIEVRYIDEQGKDVAPGVQGEHISRGPHQFVGYLNEPERTDRALTDDGWWFSGDLATWTRTAVSASTGGARRSSSAAARTCRPARSTTTWWAARAWASRPPSACPTIGSASASAPSWRRSATHCRPWSRSRPTWRARACPSACGPSASRSSTRFPRPSWARCAATCSPTSSPAAWPRASMIS